MPFAVPGAKLAGTISSPAAGWRLSVITAMQWALLIAFVMSTQYLAQPFVWKYWPIQDVLLGWLEVARDRILVAMFIAGALVLVTRVPVASMMMRAVLIALAILTGAMAGEFVLRAAGAPGIRTDIAATAGSVARWSGLALCVVGMYCLWVREGEARAAARSSHVRHMATQSMLVQTELQALRKQIEPHFLFNTLATIRRLNETAPADGTKLLRHLLEYLRSTMPSSTHGSTLGDETDLIGSYLAIVSIRMSGQLRVEIDVPSQLRAHPCPPLTLATLVENAVKHGISPAPNGGTIAIHARRDAEVLELTVADTGVGIDGATGATMGGTGIGLANVRARLRTLHGNAASLAITSNMPHGVRAVIRVPYAGGVTE